SDQLLKSRVVAEEILRAFLATPAATEAADAIALARLAIRENIVTRYQAEGVLQERGRRLRIENYILLDILGYGGMGLVYVARHQKTGDRVAIKVLGEQFKHDSGMRARFQMEAKAG